MILQNLFIRHPDWESLAYVRIQLGVSPSHTAHLAIFTPCRTLLSTNVKRLLARSWRSALLTLAMRVSARRFFAMSLNCAITTKTSNAINVIRNMQTAEIPTFTHAVLLHVSLANLTRSGWGVCRSESWSAGVFPLICSEQEGASYSAIGVSML
jgi:hypothetical protein